MRLTGGQYLWRRTKGSGKAACSREYGCSQSAWISSSTVWGAFFNTLSERSAAPSMTACISPRIATIASQKRSSSSRGSLSVGSTISVPATGNDTVGAWKP